MGCAPTTKRSRELLQRVAADCIRWTQEEAEGSTEPPLHTSFGVMEGAPVIQQRGTGAV